MERVEKVLVEMSKPAIAKPDLGNGVSHPARFSMKLLPVFAELLDGCSTILDPFAGVGRIHMLREYMPDVTTIGVEIEPEWANMHPDTLVADALDLPMLDNSFDGVCTSPTYGNRLADKHNARDDSVRRTYTHDLGRKLHENNSGAMQWGAEYRNFHRQAWREVRRVLKPGGRFVLNVKDHVRSHERQFVAGWHVTTLCRMGFSLLMHKEVETPGMRAGANADVRVPLEVVYAFELTKKPSTKEDS